MTDYNARTRAPFGDTVFPGLVSAGAGVALWIWGTGDGLGFGFLLAMIAAGTGIYCISMSRIFHSGAQALGWIGNVLAGAWMLHAGIAMAQAS